jgi:pyruvate/2-oxoglutarate dehydrogenase complex dihydrolipoamide acyltransferase (E2) component
MRSTMSRSILCFAMLLPSMVFAQEAAQPAQAQEEKAAETADAATADTPAGAGKIAAPPQGKGQIVFFREKKFAGAAVKYKVREGETELGKLSSGTYFVHVTDPGAHAYTVHSEAKDILNMEVEAGETYYVIGSISMGFLAGRPNLSPSDQAIFNGMEAKLKPAK